MLWAGKCVLVNEVIDRFKCRYLHSGRRSHGYQKTNFVRPSGRKSFYRFAKETSKLPLARCCLFQMPIITNRAGFLGEEYCENALSLLAVTGML
jgi:hypothetical protein